MSSTRKNGNGVSPPAICSRTSPQSFHSAFKLCAKGLENGCRSHFLRRLLPSSVCLADKMPLGPRPFPPSEMGGTEERKHRLKKGTIPPRAKEKKGGNQEKTRGQPACLRRWVNGNSLHWQAGSVNIRIKK